MTRGKIRGILIALAMAEGGQLSESGMEAPCARLPSLPLEDKPTCIICLGMAGSGKTTFVQVRKLTHSLTRC